VAQKVETLYVDDIDGSEAEGAVRFALAQGPWYPQEPCAVTEPQNRAF
jgi:hypothetical protein